MTNPGSDGDYRRSRGLRSKMSFGNRKRLRCRARNQLRTHVGVVEAFSEGTIISEMDNLGRRLIEVHWDNDICVYVFPSEIEIIDDGHPCDGDCE